MTIDELLAAIQTATGPDRELDCELAVLHKGGEIEWKMANWTMESYATRRFPSTDHRSGFGFEPVAAYTESVDAAIGFVPKGARWLLDQRPYADQRPDGYRADVLVYPPASGRVGERLEHWAPTPALALIGAALKARQMIAASGTPVS